MSDEITAEAEQTQQQSGQDAPQEGGNPPWLKDRLERAEKKAWKEAEAKYADAIEKAKQWDEQQEANKSELQKANEEKARLEDQLNKLRHDADVRTWADEAAAKHGIPANVLRGSTQEEIETHAEAIKALLGNQQPTFAATDIKAKPKGEGQIISEDRINKILGL